MKKQSIMIKPLSNQNYLEAGELILKIFKSKSSDLDYPPRWLKASLNPKKSKSIYAQNYAKSVKYYVAIDKYSNKVVGVIGFYLTYGDRKDSAWMAWFCVDKKYRNKGIGHLLINYLVDNLKKLKMRRLFVYTSNDPIEKDAQKLYEKLNFKIISSDKLIDEKGHQKIRSRIEQVGKYPIFYRELVIK